jgi:excisionase family DNA binding protein
MNLQEDVDEKHELPTVLTVQEAAKFLRLNVKTIYEAIEAGTFPARRIGRRIVIHRDALLDWLSCKDGVAGQRGGKR